VQKFSTVRWQDILLSVSSPVSGCDGRAPRTHQALRMPAGQPSIFALKTNRQRQLLSLSSPTAAFTAGLGSPTPSAPESRETLYRRSFRSPAQRPVTVPSRQHRVGVVVRLTESTWRTASVQAANLCVKGRARQVFAFRLQPDASRTFNHRGQPSSRVFATNALKELERAEVRFLRDALCVVIVAGQPLCKVVRSVQMR